MRTHTHSALPHYRGAHIGGLAFTALLAVMLIGCGKTKDASKPKDEKPETSKKEDDPDDLPAIEGLDNGAGAGETEVLVKNPGSANAVAQDEYIQDQKLNAGNLRGLCQVKVPKGVKVKPPPKVALDLKGKHAIAKPGKGEVAYYENMDIKRYAKTWYMANGPKRNGTIGVHGAVLRVLDIKAGKHGPLDRPSLLIRHGEIKASGGGWGSFCYGPVNTRIYVGTYDSHPSHLQLRKFGGTKVLYEGDVTSYDPKKIRKLGGGGVEFKRPSMMQTELLTETGPYELSCTRHPWQKCYAYVTKNPYITVVPTHYDAKRAGYFTINDLPVGSHTLEVWHPVYKPLKTTVEFEIKKNETTALTIEFEPPPELLGK